MWKWRAGEWISGCSLSAKYSIEHENYQKKGPPWLIHAVNVKGFRKSGMSFACGCARVISYYCTVKFLPSPGWRKLFLISFMPLGACGSSKARLKPRSHSQIPHITFMLSSPWITAEESRREGNPNATNKVEWCSWTKPHSAAKFELMLTCDLWEHYKQMSL